MGTLWDDVTFSDWPSNIDEGAYMTGVLEEGNEIQFLSSVNGYGVISLIERLDPNEFILIRHAADAEESGQQVREKGWTGGKESYTLAGKAGVTTLTVRIDVPLEMEEMFNIRISKALERIKEFSEE